MNDRNSPERSSSEAASPVIVNSISAQTKPHEYLLGRSNSVVDENQRDPISIEYDSVLQSDVGFRLHRFR